MEKAAARRSHHGCVRCKRRRQKCNEAKPRCIRCQEADEVCSYAKELKWGGRTNSRFVQANDKPTKPRQRSKTGNEAALQQVNHSSLSQATGHSVDCSETPAIQSFTNNEQATLIADSHMTDGSGPATSLELTVVRDLGPMSSLPEVTRMLLHHYTEMASRVTSCHALVQSRICRIIVPLALQTPSLLYATLALSALHWSTLLNDYSSGSSMNSLVSQYMLRSVEALRHDLQQTRGTSKHALLATIRTLCLCEIHSGHANPGSWRVHVQGAKALLRGSQSILKDESADPMLQSLTESWYASIESLAALTPRGMPQGQLEEFSPRPLIGHATGDGQFLDIYSAYKPDLNLIFKEIGAAAWERRQLDKNLSGPSILSYIDLEHEAQWLEHSIRAMFQKADFFPGVQEQLSAQEALQFVAASDAYLHTALLHVHCFVRKLPSSAVLVQESVKGIIECVKRISPTAGLSPWAMMTTPMFTAGREALGSDRDEVRGLLQTMFDTLRIRNIERALELLEQRWASEAPDDSAHREELLGETQFDFIPY